MTDRTPDDIAGQGQPRPLARRRAGLASPRAEALGNGRQYHWNEAAEAPFDTRRYWEIYAATD